MRRGISERIVRRSVATVQGRASWLGVWAFFGRILDNYLFSPVGRA